jgi:hypothetical protein
MIARQLSSAVRLLIRIRVRFFEMVINLSAELPEPTAEANMRSPSKLAAKTTSCVAPMSQMIRISLFAKSRFLVKCPP